MASRYWVGGNANWDATAGTKWATTSGGAGGAAIPTAADDVFLDGGTGTGNVTLSADSSCRSLNCTGYTGTFKHNTNTTLSVGDGTPGAGNVALKLVSGMTYTRMGASSSVTSFVSTSATQQTVDFAGKVPGSISFNGSGGSWILTGSIGGPGQIISLLSGSLDTNGQAISCNAFQATGTLTRSLTLGTSVITLAGSFNGVWMMTSTGLTFSGASSSITLTAGGDYETFRGGGLSYGSVSLTGTGTQKITGGNTYVNFTRLAPAACGVVFPASATQTFTGTVTLAGSAGNVITVTSSTPGTAATLSKASGTVSCDYLSLADSAATGGAGWYAGHNSTSVSGNTGWIFANYFSAVATITGTGSLSANGAVASVAAATLSGTGTLQAVGARTVLGAGALAGTGSLAATARRVTFTTAALTGTGSLAATARRSTFAAATLAGTGVLQATGGGAIQSAQLSVALSGDAEVALATRAPLVGVGASAIDIDLEDG